MYRYRNENTGDVVERPDRSARLDALPNWELVDQPAAESEVRMVGEHGPEPDLATLDDPAPHDPAPPTLERPAQADLKAAWVEWAVRCGADRAEAEATNKADLIAAYGRDDTDSEE